MADDQVVLDFVRVRFTRVDEALAKIDRRLDELTGRVGRLERLMADVHVQLAVHSVRMDHLGDRLGQIERRLDLVGSP